MTEQEIATEVTELKNAEEDRGITLDLVPLFVLLVAVAFVGFFAVLILKFQSSIWIVALVAALCMGAGTVYFATTVARSQKEQGGAVLPYDPDNPGASLEYLRNVLGQNIDGALLGDPGASRHLEHLLHGLALGQTVIASSSGALSLPPGVRERVQDSIKQHAEENNMNPNSSDALWSWLMREGLRGGNGAGDVPGERAQEDEYVDYVVQGLLISYLMSKNGDGALKLPEDMVDQVMGLVKERAVDQDKDPSSAGAFWAWLQEQRGGEPVAVSAGPTEAPRKRTRQKAVDKQPVVKTKSRGEVAKKKKSDGADVRMKQPPTEPDDQQMRYDIGAPPESASKPEGPSDAQQVRYDMNE